MREDVVVYSPERDEIRIHAGTKGEREMYRRAFGWHLFDNAAYFSERKAYSRKHATKLVTLLNEEATQRWPIEYATGSTFAVQVTSDI